MPQTDAPLIDTLFLGIGAMKAGTTWAYSVLRRHPEIYFTFEKEIHYFYAAHVDSGILSDRRRLRNADEKYLRFDPDRTEARALRDRLRWTANYIDGPVDDHWYRSLFTLRTPGAWAADFSNLYALLPAPAWRRIVAQTGRLRVLYTLRDPVERLWSHAKFHLALTGQADALSRWSAEETMEFLRRPYIWDHAEYGAALRRMKASLPGGVLMTAWYEEATADPAAFLAAVEDHLGIARHPWPAALLAQRVNAGAPDPVPPALRARLAPEARRIVAELADLGLTPPASWLAEPRAVA